MPGSYTPPPVADSGGGVVPHLEMHLNNPGQDPSSPTLLLPWLPASALKAGSPGAAATLMTPPFKVSPGGVVTSAVFSAPADITSILYAELFVTNLAVTEWFILGKNDLALVDGEASAGLTTGWNDSGGSDLSVDGIGQVSSTAGGLFTAQLYAQLAPAPA